MYKRQQDQILTVSLHQPIESSLAADIAFRFMQRLSLATAERLERLMMPATADSSSLAVHHDTLAAEQQDESADHPGSELIENISLEPVPTPGRSGLGWLRGAIGWGPPVAPQHSLGDK